MPMGQHLPEPPELGHREPKPEGRDITLQKGLHEGLPPTEGGLIIGFQKTVWKSAAKPELISFPDRDFRSVKGTEFQIGDAARQTFRGPLY